MPNTWRDDEAIPGSVRRPLQEWVDAVVTDLGDECLAIVLFGPLVKGDDLYAHGNAVDVLLVLGEVDIHRLDQISAATGAIHRKLTLAPVVVSEQDLRRSTDVFPTRFLSMQQHHRRLFGKDVLTDLPIARVHLRLRCEQELKNLMLKLRAHYLNRAGHLSQLIGTFAEATVAFVETLGSVLRLDAGERPGSHSDIVDAAAAKLRFEPAPVQQWLSVARGGHSPTRDEARTLVTGLMAAVEIAAHAVDQMDDADPS